jgi:hypothetical protein
MDELIRCKDELNKFMSSVCCFLLLNKWVRINPTRCPMSMSTDMGMIGNDISVNPRSYMGTSIKFLVGCSGCSCYQVARYYAR